MIPITKLTCGALAGIAGSLAMHVFRLGWDSTTNKNPKFGIFGFDREADVNSARLVSALFSSRAISDRNAERLGIALHYGYGTAIGVFYVAFSSRVPKVRIGFGTAFGGLLWLMADEIPVSLSGVSNPFGKAFTSHAGALAAHLLFGVVVEGGRSAVCVGSAEK